MLLMAAISSVKVQQQTTSSTGDLPVSVQQVTTSDRRRVLEADRL